MALVTKGGGLLPPAFPRMHAPPEIIDSLAWYDINEYSQSLTKMNFSSRDELVPLTYPHPEHPHLIGVPRTLAPLDSPHSIDDRAVGDFEFEAKFTSELRKEQVPFVADVFDSLENELGCIGEAPTGFGKTTTGCHLIARIGRPTCVVIPKGDLDWDKELIKHTNIPEDKIDVWQGGRLPNPDAWVVIAMLQSVYRLHHYPKEVYKRFACLIIDEVHRVGSQEFSCVLQQFPAMFRLGLSATPERRDGKMDLVHAHMGWRHVIGHSDADTPLYYMIDSTWMEPTDKDGKVLPYNPARTDRTKRSLMADQFRNSQICGAAYRAHAGGRRTIIFIEQTKHGDRIEAGLKHLGVPASKIVRYDGGIKKDDKARAKECPEGMILIATYKYTAEGTNIPPLDTAIIAHPIYDPRQAVGRILRKVDGKPRPIVIDVWDRNSGPLTRIAKARWEYLRKNGAVWKGTFQ